MPSEQIQWFPGHMAKTRRLMREILPKIDLVIELLDARIPFSSQNPDLPSIVGDKPVLTVMTKASLADPAVSLQWKKHFAEKGIPCLPVDCVTGEGIRALPDAVKDALTDKLEKYEQRGMTGRRVRVMVAGIPNVGKSSLINRLSGGKRAKVENRPGVTKENQWITTPYGIDLLDTPGTLWPKFELRLIGEHLAITGAIKDEVTQVDVIAQALLARLRMRYPANLSERYKLGDMAQYDRLADWQLLEVIGRKRGLLLPGNEVNTERTANMLLDEFRAGKMGRITLETPIAPRKERAADPEMNQIGTSDEADLPNGADVESDTKPGAKE